MAKQNLGGVYANMEFPPYSYVEYPKHINITKGKYEVANNKREEDEIRNRLKLEIENAPIAKEFVPTDPIKELLIARAKELHVPINAKWSITKLQAVISEAEKAIDDLPPEGAETDEISSPVSTATNLKLIEEVDEENHTEEDKDALIARAKELGLNVNKLFGIPRLKMMIAEAEGK